MFGGKKRDLIVDLLHSVQTKQDEQLKEIVCVKERVIKIETNVEQNTCDLADHVEGVIQTRKMIEKDRIRLSKLEMPRKLMRLLLKWVTSAGVIIGVVYTAYRFYIFVKVGVFTIY